MRLGFAINDHCNLRCPHCIRDDVETVRVLDVGLFEDILDQAIDCFGDVSVSLTGGEPLIHPRFDAIIEALRTRDLVYRLVSNGWHLRRAVSIFDRHLPELVRLSLSGATEATHDGERGKGSFQRVLEAVAILTSRETPTYFAFVVDRRVRHELAEAVRLAEGLGCNGIFFILPQPTVGSAKRNSDLRPDAWMQVRREVEDLRESCSSTTVALDYGAPPASREDPCPTFAMERMFIDAQGRVCSCCQLSQYGFNESEIIADLKETRLERVFGDYRRHVLGLRAANVARMVSGRSPLDALPCIRCVLATNKMRWISGFGESDWKPLVDATAM